jgi:hypothetical protein
LTSVRKSLPAKSPRQKSAIRPRCRICSSQWSRPSKYTGGGAYDGEPVFQAVLNHQSNAQVLVAWRRITGYNLRNYAELAVHRYKNFPKHHKGPSAATPKDRGMDHCVYTGQNKRSRYAGDRESLGSSECQGALLNFALFSNA